jgi:hypothetical protein
MIPSFRPQSSSFTSSDRWHSRGALQRLYAPLRPVSANRYFVLVNAVYFPGLAQDELAQMDVWDAEADDIHQA